MISLTTFKSSLITAGARVLKVLGWGNSALTADECMPFGIDSNPVKNMIAVYAETEEAGEPVIIGYINKNQLAGPGETRTFSLKADGTIATYAWLRSNGTIELGGTANNLVKFSPLQSALSSHNTDLNGELLKIQSAIAALGGTYARSSVNMNINSSKINEIKTI